MTVMTNRAKSHLTGLIQGIGNVNPTHEQMAAAARQASVYGMNDAFVLAGIICVGALVLSFFIQRPKPSAEIETTRETKVAVE